MPNPENLPLWELAFEAELAEERLNHQHATAAALIQQAVASLLDKEAGKSFQETIESLMYGATAD